MHYQPRNAGSVPLSAATADDERIGTTTIHLNARVLQHGRGRGARGAVPQTVLLTRTVYTECLRAP